MASQIDVKVVGRAKRMLENVPKSKAAQEVAAHIQTELLGIQGGYIKLPVASGKTGIHNVLLGEHRVAKLCMRRPTQRVVEVHLIKLVKRRG